MKSERPSHTLPAVRQQAKELRKSMTNAEELLWQRLRNRNWRGLKFRRQCPIGPFIADFYCAQFRLVIEIDGGIHERQREADQARSQQFSGYGYQVIRFQNREVEDDIEGVLNRIWDFCQDSDKTPLPLSGEG
jgi:very-short-patch-repair endonuclease